MTWQCPRCKVEYREPQSTRADVKRCEVPNCHVRYVVTWPKRREFKLYLVSKTSPHMSEDYL